MASIPPPARPSPQVNDGYWFTFSKNLVDGAIKQRDDAADKLQSLTVWLWTIYTAGAAVGINFGKLHLSPALALMLSVPSVLLIAAYWQSVRVRMPVADGFDPRSPTDIQRVYIDVLARKDKLLTAALRLSAIAAALTALGLSVAAVVGDNSTLPQLNVTVVDGIKGPSLAIHSVLPGAKGVRVIVTQNTTHQTMEPIDRPVVPENGVVDLSIPVESATSPLTVEIKGTNEKDKSTFSIKQTVKPVNQS